MGRAWPCSWKKRSPAPVLCASAVRGQQEGSREDAQQSEKELVHQADRPWSGDRSRHGSRRAGEGGRRLVRVPGETQAYQAFATDFPSYENVVNASDYGIPARPHGNGLRHQPRRSDRGRPLDPRTGTPSDKIEFVRTQPRSIGEPQVVSAGFDWKDAGIGAGLALALVLLGTAAALASRHVGRAQTA